MKTRRFFRRLRQALGWLSLAVFVCVVLVAAIQLFRPDAIGFIHRHHQVETRTLRTIHLTACDGGVWFDWAYPAISPLEMHEHWSRMMRDQPHWWQRFGAPGGYTADNIVLGFYFSAGSSGDRTLYCIVRLPYWFVAVVSAAGPALALRRRLILGRRARRGLCPWCGYDLRATPGRCPECGHTPPSGGWVRFGCFCRRFAE